MERFEYWVSNGPILCPDAGALTEWLNEAAADGWRLVTVSQGRFYFERKLANA